MWDQLISLFLILASWSVLLVGYIAVERIRKQRNRERFDESMRRWWGA